MTEHIEKLTRLNVELEGLLHVLAKRDTTDLRKLLGEKYAEFKSIFEELLNEGEPEPEAVEETLEKLDLTLTEDEVKDQEAVSDEVNDETDEAAEAIEKGAEHGAPAFNPGILDMAGESAPIAEPAQASQPVVEPLTSNENTIEAQDMMDSAEIVSVSIEDSPEEEAPGNQAAENVYAPVSEPLGYSQPMAGDDIRVDEMLSRRGAEDLKKVFTLNDKFRFRRELFRQDDDLFRHALADLNTMPDYASACQYVKSRFATPENAETVDDFLAIIKPHYC